MPARPKAPRYTPMQPTQVRQPFHRDGWVYEEKLDGWRMLAYKDGRTVRLESRNGVDHTRRFPELAAAVAALPSRTLVLDGEVAGGDQTKRPLRERRARLEEIVAGAERIFPVRRLTSNGLVAWGEVLQDGFEGYVAKDDASPYVGGVTRSWLKVKVSGWTDPEDRWKRVRLQTP
jgi:bifunctional non-homologous end joining protein LigD